MRSRFLQAGIGHGISSTVWSSFLFGGSDGARTLMIDMSRMRVLGCMKSKKHVIRCFKLRCRIQRVHEPLQYTSLMAWSLLSPYAAAILELSIGSMFGEALI